MKPVSRFAVSAAWPVMALTTILAAGPAVAQEQAPAQQAPAAAAAPVAQFGDIVVTAQRRSERLHDVPLTVTAQTGQDLARAGVTSLRELNVAVPGLQMAGQGPYTQAVVRGVSTSIVGAGAESPIATYLDGVYLPNQAGNAFDLPDIERVEVLKGPQGTLFGRNATGGAISIHTLDPSFKTSGMIGISDGVFAGNDVHTSNEVSLKGFINVPVVNDVLAASVAGYYDNGDGYLTNERTGKGTGRFRTYLVRGKVLFKPTDTLKIVATGYYTKKYDATGAAVEAYRGNTVAAEYPGAIIPTDPWHNASELSRGVETLNTVTKGGSLHIDWTLGEAGTLSSLTAYTYVNAHILAEVDGAYSPNCVATFACITPYGVTYGPTKTFQQELTFTSRKFGIFSLTAGAFIYHDSADYGTSVNPPLDADGHVSGPAGYFTSAHVGTRAYAGFGELNTDISSRLHLITGIRYNWEHKEGSGSVSGGPAFDVGGSPTAHAWTPRVSVRYDLSRDLNVYATYSKGFKSAVLNTVALTQDVAKPEKLDSYEVGIKYASRNTNISLSGFYYDYKNLQVQFFQDVATILGNASARLYGLDFDGSTRLTSDFSVRLAGSWLPHAKYRSFVDGVAFALPQTPAGMTQVTVDASGNRLLRAPKFSGNATLTYNHDLGRGTLDGNVTLYYSSSYHWELLDRVNTRQYVTLGANIGYTPAGTKLRFSIWGKNLTNKAYVTGTTLSAEADTVVWGAPRQMGVSAEYRF